ncbi:MAG: UDP-glucose--hexose-1-phosphate uridylyltransferase, partial [Collinsella sp.]
HAAWAEDVFARRADELTADNAIDILHEEVGVVFGHVLDNAGVFKWDEAGRAAQQRFIDSL